MYRGGGGYGRPKTAPPDLPSLLLDARICYLGMPVQAPTTLLCRESCIRCQALYLTFVALQIVPAVTELIVAELLWLDFDNPAKPIYFYINSTGTQVVF